MSSKFLVIVYPAPPATRDLKSPNSGSYTVAMPPQVKWVTARSPKLAVESVTVVPGGHALVVPEADVSRFDRPQQAELVEKGADGNPIPQVMDAQAA